MNYEVGKKYLVDVAVCKDFKTGRKVIIPILPLRHKDPAFGVNRYHYHIDCRFQMTKSVAEGTQVSDYKTVVPIWDVKADIDDSLKRYKIKSIEKRLLTCVSTTTGFDLDYLKNPPTRSAEKGIKKYFDWYKSMVGKSCAGKKCPHYGTEMIDNGKYLVCPMHNLVGNKKTEKIIAMPKKLEH